MARAVLRLPPNRSLTLLGRGGVGPTVDDLTWAVDALEMTVDRLLAPSVTGVLRLPANATVAYVGRPGPGSVLEALVMTVDELVQTVDALASL